MHAPTLPTLLLAAALVAASVHAADFISSGDADIDRARREIATAPTGAANARDRALLLYCWIGSLQQQCADTRDYYDHDQAYYKQEGLVARLKPGPELAQAQVKLGALIDAGFAAVEHIQRRLRTEGPIARSTPGDPATVPPGGDMTAEWPMFQANVHHTGYSAAPGPREGRAAWKFPVGLGWYARPVIAEGRVYLASPGMRTTGYCLDLETGAEIWKSTQQHPLLGLYKYPAIASTPVLQGDRVVLREVNSHGGNEGQARNLVFLDRATGREVDKQYAGHIDYRTQYAPVAASARYTVYPFGVHDIYGAPAICQNFNRLICADATNTRKYWDFNVGDIDALAEPVIDGDRVYCGTMEGYLYALNLGPVQEGRLIAWSFKAAGAVNTAVAVADGRVYFGCNAGRVYCLDAATGTVVWQRAVGAHEPGARKHFSTPALAAGTLYVGSADHHLHALDAATGAPHWARPLDNWVRARPVLTRRGVVAATVSGRAFAFSTDGTPQWEAAVSPHPIYADLAATPDRIVFSDSNLLSFCLDADGAVQWTRSHLPAWTDAAGQRIFTDQISGGTYYQSKPTAYRGKLFFGTPAGFLHAVDARSGKELWKFEMGGGISVAPACVDGKVYAGQQGGERFFYCLDAETGALVWKQTLPGGWVWGSATVDDGLVFVPTVNGYAVCLDGRTGHIVWMYPMAMSVPAEPAIDGDLVYFGSWSRSLYAFKKRTGEIAWKHNGVALDSGTLIAYGGSIYLPHHANMFLQLDAATGAVLSEGITDARAKGRFSDFNATPAFHDGRAFFSARGSIGLRGVPLFSTLYCVDPAAGRVLWTHPDGGGLSAPAIANGRVYIASGNTPFLYCLDAATGATRWIYRMGHRVEEATLCIYQDRVFALAADGFVHAIQ